MLPLGGSSPWHRWEFWAGLLFVAFPLNLVVYGWNDVVDAETDRLNPRKDSWLFGAAGTDEQWLIIAIVAAEVGMLFFIYNDALFGSMLLAAIGWLLLDVFWLFRARSYSLVQMKVFGAGANTLALGSMAYVWWARCLLQVP